MKRLKIVALSMALLTGTLSQTATVRAIEITKKLTTPMCSNYGMSGYTLYVYKEGTSVKLGEMHIYVRGTKAYNTFTAERYCSPYVKVGFDKHFMASAGGSCNYIENGKEVTAVQTGGHSNEAYGYAQVTYKDYKY